MRDHNGDPLSVIKNLPPCIDLATVRHLLRRDYGLDGELLPLVSERDQNFRVTIADGKRYVLKIANATEDRAVTRFQIDALLHMQKKVAPRATFDVPRIIKAQDGSTQVLWQHGDNEYVVRLVSFVAGVPLGERPRSAALCRNIGRALAELGVLLNGFSHPGENPSLLWDMKRAAQLRRLLVHVGDAPLREVVARALDDFENLALPRFAELRWQVIHNDLNPENILVRADDTDIVDGVIDFGDMLRSPLIIDVAVAASYLRPTDGDPLSEIEHLLAGYNEVTPLQRAEVEILPLLIRARLAATVSIRCWRASERAADDQYLLAAEAKERSADRQLLLLDALPSATAGEQLWRAATRNATAGR